MKPLRIDAPGFQNWACHGCTECCRGGMYIELSAAEKARIESQGWTKETGVDPASMIVAENGRFRLGHSPDGACVFLEGSKCRIHARFGEAAKPIACRLFPLAFHPAGKKVLAGLRFSCPSAITNQGKPLSQQMPEMLAIAKEIVPEDFSEIPAPAVVTESGLEWADLLQYVTWLDKYISDPNKPMAAKLRDALSWLDKLKSSAFDQVSGPDADVIFKSLADLVRAEKTPSPGAPSFIGRVLFRTLVFVYLRRDTVADLQGGSPLRFGTLWAMLKYSGGLAVPKLPGDNRTVLCRDVEKAFGPLPAEAEALLTRFFRLKIQSLHFCGRAYYDVPLMEGFQSLALLYAVIHWIARWRAAVAGRTTLIADDVATAIKLADHHHGYSPALGSASARRRVQLLAQRGDIIKLCFAQ